MNAEVLQNGKSTTKASATTKVQSYSMESFWKVQQEKFLNLIECKLIQVNDDKQKKYFGAKVHKIKVLLPECKTFFGKNNEYKFYLQAIHSNLSVYQN